MPPITHLCNLTRSLPANDRRLSPQISRAACPSLPTPPLNPLSEAPHYNEAVRPAITEKRVTARRVTPYRESLYCTRDSNTQGTDLRHVL